MRAPLFTVLLPTHDRADVLGAAIRSVLAQSLADFELIVVGDGCTDASAEVVAAFDDPRIIWHDLPKAPHFGYANRNISLRQARGELVAYAAHDDLMLPDHLELLARPFGNARICWAYSRPLWVNDDGIVLPFFVNLAASRQARARFLADTNVLPSGCIAHRRALFDTVGYWPEDLPAAADWAMWRRIIGACGPGGIGFVREPTQLHFRAAWRTGNIPFGPDPLPRLEALARGPGWPAGLKLQVPEGPAPIQARVMDLLDRRAPRVVEALRTGTLDLQDAIAWSALDP